MKRSTSMITAAVLALATGGLVVASSSLADEKRAEMEKCYGVARAEKNDCQTATSACAGTAKKDRQKDAFIAVPKGTCGKIAGGSLTPG